MAKIIQAFAAYCPRIELRKAIDPRHFIQWITRRTTHSSGVVRNVQESEVETLIDLLSEGYPVHTGVAIFTPSIDLQGNIRVRVRVDKRIVSAINGPGVFTGEIKNRRNIGKTAQEILAQWNEDHPDNQAGQEEN